jgi:hypothetical protein
MDILDANVFCPERMSQMAANGCEDADISLFDTEGCLVESPRHIQPIEPFLDLK